jgi:type I restriction enzyme S subunit
MAAWEQRKLGDECNQLTTVINPQNEPNRLFAEYSMPAYDLDKNPDYVLGSTMNSARKVIDRPCLLINKLNVRKQRIWCIEDPEKNAVCSAEFIPVCSEGIDLRFLSYVVSGNAFTSYLEDCSSGSSNSQKRVTPDTIMNAEICMPSRAEQQIIGAYFRDLDHLITLHQREPPC